MARAAYAAGWSVLSANSLYSLGSASFNLADFVARDRDMPDVQPGDLLAVLTAGAYGYVLSSNYNTRPRPAEVLVNRAQAELIRPRETLESLMAGEKL